MRSTSRALRAAAALAALALVASACGGSDAPAASGPAPSGPATSAPEAPLSITLMLPSDNPLQYYPLYIADTLGYYAEEGLDVTIEVIGGSGAVMQQVIANNADIGMPSPPAYLNGVSRDNDIVWFYQVHYTNVFDLIAPVEGGLTSPEQLRGQTVGVSEFSGGEVPFVRAIMGEAGFVEGVDWELIQIGEGGALTFNALETGQAQAYGSSIYDVASLNAAGLPTRSIMPDAYKNFPANGLVITRDTLENRSDMLTRFTRAVNKAVVFGRTNPDAALALSTAGRADLYDDERIVAAFWEATLSMMTPPAAVANEAVGLPYLAGWQGFHDFLAGAPEDAGGLPRPVDLSVAITTSIVESAMDFDVAAIEEQARNFAG